MNLIVIPLYYIRWHYGQALRDFSRNWKNFLIFTYNFFSIHKLLSSLISPWERMGEVYVKGSFETTVGTFIINSIMRVVGAVIRLLFIVIGSISLVCVVVLGLVLFVAWLFLPFILVHVAVLGFNLIFP